MVYSNQIASGLAYRLNIYSMTTKQLATGLSIAALSLGVFVPSVHAQECTTQYGGTVVCPPVDLTINKQVAQPVTQTKGGTASAPVFVENLGTNQPFGPGAEVLYRLVVKNTGSVTLNPVTVRDVLPAYLTFVSGAGSYDANSRTLTMTLDNLTAGESRTIDFVAKVVPATQFPTGQNTFCVTNYADVRSGNRFDDDTAQACLQAAPYLPVAGFNDFALLLPFAGVGLSGLALIKRKKN